MVVILTPSVPPIIRAMFSIPNIALQNTMACRVYRLLKLGRISDDPESFTLRSNSINLPYIVKRRNTFDGSHLRRNGGREKIELSTTSTVHNAAPNSKTVPMHVEIDQQIEADNGSRDQFKLGSLA